MYTALGQHSEVLTREIKETIFLLVTEVF